MIWPIAGNGNIKADIVLNNGDVVLVPEMDVFLSMEKSNIRAATSWSVTCQSCRTLWLYLTARGSVRGMELNRQVGSEIKSHKSNLRRQDAAQRRWCVKTLF